MLSPGTVRLPETLLLSENKFRRNVLVRPQALPYTLELRLQQRGSSELYNQCSKPESLQL